MIPASVAPFILNPSNKKSGNWLAKIQTMCKKERLWRGFPPKPGKRGGKEYS